MREKGKQPRICFSQRSFPKYFLGGAELQSHLIARHMLEQGWSVHFTTEDWGQPTAKLENENGIWVHKLKGSRFFNPITCWSFYRELIRINCDVYYQRGGWEYTFMISLAAKALRRKFVWGTSLTCDCEGTKFRGTFRDENIRGIRGLLLWPDAWIRDTLVSLGLRRADAIVVQDESQRTALKRRFGKDSLVIKTGHAIPERPKEKRKPPLVVWIANAKRWKQPEMFVRLAEACRDLPARFLLAGGRPTSRFRRQLMKEAVGLRNLEVRWSVPFEETNELLAAASLLVNTSTREGFPNTFVQAWLQETPVVSLRLDPDGVLSREKIGIRSGNLQQMVEDVGRLVQEDSLREEMGKRARTYAVREHNLADKLEEYVGLFESLCNESRMVQPA